MSGGFITCGEFIGRDKSGSALYGVAEELKNRSLPPPAMESLQLIDDALQEGDEHIRIDPADADHLRQPLLDYRRDLEQRLGGITDVNAALLRDEELGLKPSEAKWGKGDGWKYYCVCDLLTAIEAAQNNGKPVVFTFE